MIIRSIRWRLQLWYGLLLVAVLAVFGLIIYRLEQARQIRQVDEALQRRAAVMAITLRPLHVSHLAVETNRPTRLPVERPAKPKPKPPRTALTNATPLSETRRPPDFARLFDQQDTNSYYYILWSATGTELTRSTNAPAELRLPMRLHTGSSSASCTRGWYRELIEVAPGGTVLVGCSLRAVRLELQKTLGRLVGAGGIVLVLGLAGGWWLASRAIAPIQLMSATAGKIAAGDLAQRIKMEDTESELGRLAGVLNSTFTRLEAAFAQQGRFTSDAAHELRTPVTVLLTRIQTTLAQPREASQYQETLEICQRTVQRMRRLIESLLELARLDAGQETMQQARFDLAKLIQDSIEQLRPLALERGVPIHQAGSALPYEGDSDRLAQVMTNLMSNAIHYNREGGQVWITATSDNDSVVITVRDDGIGISPAALPHIFERFYRADPSRSTQRGHTGLGLAISKAIVEAHGGTISVVSQPGTGSTFTVHLPQRGGCRLQVAR